MRIVWKFFLEIIIGVIIFVLIAGVAVGLSLLVNYWKEIGIDPVITYSLTIFEYILFFLDLIVFAKYLYKTTKQMLQEL